MFSKSKINEPGPKADGSTPSTPDAPASSAAPAVPPRSTDFKASAPKAKPPASTLSADLHITGNLKTTGDIQVEGTVEGDIRAHLLTIGETATIKGEVIADDVVVNGAELKDGMLVIDLEKIVPEEKKPKSIKIK